MPDMTEIIAKVIADNSITFNDSRDYGELTASTLTPGELARAVLAAISEAGAVEWGVFRKDSATEKLSEYVWASAEDATHWAAGEFTPDFAAITEARSRLTFPWERVELESE